MKPRFFILLISILASLAVNAQSSRSPYASYTIPSYTDQEVKLRLNQIINAIVPARFDAIVRSYVNTYTVRKRDRTEAMLGRAVMYFPIMEEIMQQKNMPMDLKYLSVVESALDPKATSRSGAAGLWQFMPPTGREKGLKINRFVDERRDPHKSTDAAMRYLKQLFDRYGNWELALAAYNGGPGRVNRAIKRGKSKNFWRIRKYLPRETRNYVPAYIAATYIMQYYQMHNLVPLYPALDLQMTAATKVYQKFTFEQISAITGVSIDRIALLNPSYKKNVLLANQRGNFLILPQNGMLAMHQYLGRPDKPKVYNLLETPIQAPNHNQRLANERGLLPPPPAGDYIKSNYTVRKGDRIEDLAKLFHCTTQNILTWNRLSTVFLHEGQLLYVYLPREKITVKRIESFPSVPALPIAPSVSKKPISTDYKTSYKRYQQRNSRKKQKTKTTLNLKAFAPEQYLFYQIQRRETLVEIADKFHGVTVKDIMQLNNITKKHLPIPGRKLKIKKI